MVTKEQAMTSRYFYHMTEKYADGGPRVYRANGQCKTWKTRPDEFRLPVKFGWKDCTYITERNADEFTTDPDETTAKDEWEKFDFRHEVHKAIRHAASKFMEGKLWVHSPMLVEKEGLGRCCRFGVSVEGLSASELDWLALGDFIRESVNDPGLVRGSDDILCEVRKLSKVSALPGAWSSSGLWVFVKAPKPELCPDHIMERVNAERMTNSYWPVLKDAFVPGEVIVRMWNSLPQVSLLPTHYIRTVGVRFRVTADSAEQTRIEHVVIMGNQPWASRTNGRFSPRSLHYRKKESQS